MGYGNNMTGYKIDDLGIMPANMRKEQYLDRVAKYYKEEGIDYKEFQRREYLGLIPKTKLNELKGNYLLALKEPKKTYTVTGSGRKLNK